VRGETEVVGAQQFLDPFQRVLGFVLMLEVMRASVKISNRQAVGRTVRVAVLRDTLSYNKLFY